MNFLIFLKGMFLQRILKSNSISVLHSLVRNLASKRSIAAQKLKNKKVKTVKTNVNQAFRDWTNILQAESDAENHILENLLESRSRDQMELRGWAVCDLRKTGEDFSGAGRLCAFKVPQKHKMREIARFFRPGTPISICVNENFHLLSEAFISDIDESKRLILVKMQTSSSVTLRHNQTFAIRKSTTRGAMQSLISFLSARDKTKNECPGDHIMAVVFRDKKFPIIHSDPKINFVSNCDDSQARAIKAALNKRRPFICIQGPPGTGKTKVISEIICQLVKKNQKVLVCAPSHAAVDNALNRVHDATIALRMRADIDTEMQDCIARHDSFDDLELLYDEIALESENHAKIQIAKKAERLRSQMMQDVLKERSAIFCTVNSKLTYTLRSFGWKPDVVIIDEAAMCIEPSSWVPILNAARAILVGDHQQLPPLVFSQKGKDNNLHVSLMERLANEFKGLNVNFMLDTQYRMNEKIMIWSNQVFYEDKLKAGYANANISISDVSQIPADSPFSTPLILFDTTSLNSEEVSGTKLTSLKNHGEAKIVCNYAQKLISAGVNPVNIGIISPYFEQVELLKKMISNDAIVINTVDAFQGQERDIIIFSMVRDNQKGILGFLKDYRRLNVAITRSKRQFVLVGNQNMLECDATLKSLRDTIHDHGLIIDAAKLIQLGNLIAIPSDYQLKALRRPN